MKIIIADHVLQGYTSISLGPVKMIITEAAETLARPRSFRLVGRQLETLARIHAETGENPSAIVRSALDFYLPQKNAPIERRCSGHAKLLNP